MLEFIVALAIIGVVAGYLARLLVPGPDPIGFGATVVVGMIGSFVGGFLGWALFGKDLAEGALQTSGIIGSVLGAIVVLLIYRSTAGTRSGSRI
jgi:uncharacterized membrane protein YeaQ/YmgE (transglycosylase-associated protein family)